MVDTEPPFTEYFLSGMLRSRPDPWSRFGGIDKRKSLDQEYDLGQKEGKLPHLLICLKENSLRVTGSVLTRRLGRPHPAENS